MTRRIDEDKRACLDISWARLHKKLRRKETTRNKKELDSLTLEICKRDISRSMEVINHDVKYFEIKMIPNEAKNVSPTNRLLQAQQLIEVSGTDTIPQNTSSGTGTGTEKSEGIKEVKEIKDIRPPVLEE